MVTLGTRNRRAPAISGMKSPPPHNNCVSTDFLHDIRFLVRFSQSECLSLFATIRSCGLGKDAVTTVNPVQASPLESAGPSRIGNLKWRCAPRTNRRVQPRAEIYEHTLVDLKLALCVGTLALEHLATRRESCRRSPYDEVFGTEGLKGGQECC